MEYSKIKEVPDTPQLRAPFENLTVKADVAVMQEGEEKKREIEQTKTDLRNQYLILRRNRNDRFAITVGYLFSKLSGLIGYVAADKFRQKCLDENEELQNAEIMNLGQEFMAIARKPNADRDMSDENRKREILALLQDMVPQSQLDEMVQDANKAENRVKEREKAAELRRQRLQASAATGRVNEEEKKQQGSLGLPLPQAQRDNRQQRGRRPSIEMTVTFEEENGIEHVGQSTEQSCVR